ncbi:MAG: hypothetical protein IKE20_04350, partial [Eggerthellaceae bacterium]|nr:hypothetical protein [Eggerthellaceae bacterium]
GGGGDTLATLYDNSTGTGANSTLTLSSTSADYDYLDIIFTDGNRRYTERLYDPNGKTFSLFRSVCSGTTIYHNTLMGSVSGTTVTLGAEAQATINNGAVGTSTSTTLKVIKVFGGTSTSPSSASGVSF